MSERLRRYTLPALLAIALFAVAALAGYFTKGNGDGNPALGDAAANPSSGTRGSLQSLSGDTLIVQTEGGPRQFTLSANASVEALKPTAASTISIGEWLNAGAIPHNQTVFTIVGLTLIPQALLQDR